MNIYEQVKQALQDIVAPELKSIQVEIRRLDDKIDSLDNKLTTRIDSLKSEITTEIKRLDEKIDSSSKRLSEKIDSLDDKIDTAIQIRERLAVIEAKLAGMEAH